jgi:hypothetical protein
VESLDTDIILFLLVVIVVFKADVYIFMSLRSSHFVHLHGNIACRRFRILLHGIMYLHIQLSGVGLTFAAIESSIDKRS